MTQTKMPPENPGRFNPGKNNDQVYKEVDWWKHNNPNRYGHHWEAQYTYDSNWNITDVTVVEVQDDYYA
jgi:hypothetical protein